MIEKISCRGLVKIKSVEFLYDISSLELAHKCCRLIESILKMNWNTIKEKDKNNKKIIEKFSVWVLFWSLSGLIDPENISKFEKCFLEAVRIQGM